MSEENIPDVTEVPVTEKKYRGCRGPDKSPRNYNPISEQNLKQNQKTPELNNDVIENTVNVPSFSSKLLLVALIFVLIIIVGAIILKLYRDYIKNRPK